MARSPVPRSSHWCSRSPPRDDGEVRSLDGADRRRGGDELPHVRQGARGKADPKKSKIYIGWVNQQGGQVVIGGLATAGAQLAVRYVNDQLGGVGGHPVALVQCFIKSNEEEGTTCGQKLVNDRRISVIATGAVATGAQSLHATIRGAKRRHRCRHHPGRRSAEERGRPLRRRGAHPPAVRHVREERPQGEDRCGRLSAGAGITEAALVIAAGLRRQGIDGQGSRLHRVSPT